MKMFFLACVAISLVCIADDVRAQSCLIKMEGRIHGKWQGPCPNGVASGTGTAILENATYHGTARNGRAIGKGQIKLGDGTTYECEFGGWAIDCPDVDLDVRSSRLVGQPADSRAEGEAAAVGAAENPSRDQSADGRLVRRDSRAMASGGESDVAVSAHGDPVERTESAASFDGSPAAAVAAAPPGRAVAAEPVSAQPPVSRCKLEFNGQFVDWSGRCEKGRAAGEGTARVGNGMTYTGSAKHGQAHGFGTVDGPHYYQGRFKDGLRHGSGIYLGSDGSYYKAMFENGFQATDGVLVQGSSRGDDTAADIREASILPHRDEDESESGKNDSWAQEKTAEARSAWSQPGGAPAEDPGGEENSYDRALARSQGDQDGLIRGATLDDSYESKLADQERREAEREKALAIEANFRKKQREAELRSEALKAKLRKKAEAREAEKARKRERLDRDAAAAWKKKLGSGRPSGSGTTLFGGGGSAQRALNTLLQQQQRYQQRQAEQQRQGEDYWISRPMRSRPSGRPSRGSIQ